MKKYYKNGYLNLLLTLIYTVYLLIVLPVYFCAKLDFEITIMVIIGLLSPYIIYYVVGFYWVLQKISIDKDGIYFYLFNKKIKELSWEHIEEIKVYRSGSITFVIKEKDINKYHNIYISRKIESLIKKYAPKELFCE